MIGNPIYHRLTHHSRLPSPRVALWAAFVVGLIIGGGVLRETLTLTYNGAHVGSWIALIGTLLTLLAPLVTAVVAALLTARDVQQDDFKLVRLTGLSREAIIAGYASTTLHRVRWLLAALVALWPGIVIGWAQFGIYVLVVFQNIMLTTANSQPTGIPGTVAQQTVIPNALTFGALALAWWFQHGVAALVGVSSGLAIRRASGAAISALLVMLAVCAAPILICVWIPFYALPGSLQLPGWAQLTAALVVIVAIMGIAIWGSMSAARRSLDATNQVQ